jgi:erythritol kinase
VLDRTFTINGSLASAGLLGGVLAWLRRHDPERLTRSRVSLTCNGWLFAQLTGEVGSDESDASAPFLDIRSRRYSNDLLALYDLEWARDLLPEVRGDDRRVAPLTSVASSQTGLRAGTPVVMAPYDIAATAIGVGAVTTGQACCILGTTLSTETVTDRVDTGGAPAGITIALGVPGLYLRAFPTLAGGEVVQWARSLLGLSDPAELGLLAAKAGPGAAGLAFLPYLSPAGERAPFLDPRARGALLGLSFEHSREHVARAVLEGLSLVVQDCLETASAAPVEIGVCGGGAANPVWTQMIADVTGVPVLRTVDTQVGARGAFLVGAVATGTADDILTAAATFVRRRDTFSPDPVVRELYADLFGDFRELRLSMAQTWPRLTEMRRRSHPYRAGS